MSLTHAYYARNVEWIPLNLLMHRRLIATSLPKLEMLALNVRHVTEPALEFLVACTALTALELNFVRFSFVLRKHAAAQPLR